MLFCFLFFYTMYVFLSSRARAILPLPPPLSTSFGVSVGFGAVYSCSMACVSVCQCMLCNVRYALCIRCYSFCCHQHHHLVVIIFLLCILWIVIFLPLRIACRHTIIQPDYFPHWIDMHNFAVATIGTKKKHPKKKHPHTHIHTTRSLFPTFNAFRSLPLHNFTMKIVEIFKIVCNWLHHVSQYRRIILKISSFVERRSFVLAKLAGWCDSLESFASFTMS